MKGTSPVTMVMMAMLIAGQHQERGHFTVNGDNWSSSTRPKEGDDVLTTNSRHNRNTLFFFVSMANRPHFSSCSHHLVRYIGVVRGGGSWLALTSILFWNVADNFLKTLFVFVAPTILIRSSPRRRRLPKLLYL